MDFSLLSQPYMVPVWLTIGGTLRWIAGLAFRYLIDRKQTDATTVKATFEAINVAQNQLTQSLFNQIREMRAELEQVRTEARECESKFLNATARIAELESIVKQLQAGLSMH